MVQTRGNWYLIIIDDIWATSAWDIISRALPDSDCGRIITTTQVEDVALACCSYQLKHIYEITPLNDDESVKSGGGCTTNPSSEGVQEALNLVYNSLPPHLKTCLLYLNMYQEGYTIKKDELVRLWVAEGFIRAVQGEDMEDTAGAYFDELVSRGMIQTVDTDLYGKVLSCTVHNMVLDLMRQKCMEENFVTIVNYYERILGLPDKVRRLSVQFGGAKGANNIPEIIRKCQVRSLIFSGYFKCVPSIVDYGLLRVLILYIWADQDKQIVDLTSIDELYRLRYLKIECNLAIKLPGEVGRLQDLVTLQVDARLSAVPSDIVDLDKLQHLRLPSKSVLPRGVLRMTSLRTLGYFDLGRNSEDNVDDQCELTNLQDLRCWLSPEDRSHESNSTNTHDQNLLAKEPSQHLVGSMTRHGSILEKSNNLQSLILGADPSSTSLSCDDLSSVSPASPHLERIELLPRICIFPSLPRWIGVLKNLCILKIAVRELSKNYIVILRELPALTALSLSAREVE